LGFYLRGGSKKWEEDLRRNGRGKKLVKTKGYIGKRE